MTKVVLDLENEELLRGVDEVVEVCDHSGKLMGYFRPIGAGEPSWKHLSRFSDDELRERCAQTTGGRPLSEILHDLNQR